MGNISNFDQSYPHVWYMSGQPGANPNHWWKAVFFEFFATFFLVFVVYATAVDQRASKSVYGMAIGATVTMSAFGLSKTGGALNPCRWLGPAVINWNSLNNQTYGLYWWAPILGGVAAGSLYNWVLLGKHFKKNK